MYRRNLVVATMLFACQRAENPSPGAQSHESGVVVRADAPSAVDVQGIAVRFLDGGAIQITGRDRWGNPLDATYENAAYLRDALPVLERSITAEQAWGLRSLVEHR